MASITNPGASGLVLVNQIDMLFQVSSLIETHLTALVLALEGLFLSVDSQMGIEFADRAEHFIANALLLLR